MISTFKIRLLCGIYLLMIIVGSLGQLTAQTPITFRYFYDELGQLTKVIDSTGTVIEYVYDPVGNILQIKRSTIALGTLAILNFTPQHGAIGETVTIQGQGFDITPANNTVQFNGAAASVVSASANTLLVAVPAAASAGPISVTVAGQTATSATNFNVIQSPLITSMSRKSALFNTLVPNLLVTGINLSGATFTFQPLFSPPAIEVTSASIAPSGTAAALAAKTGTQAGTFILVATNSAGSSTSVVLPGNRFSVVDPHSLADSDGDGVPDAVEAAFGSDPLDPASLPQIGQIPEAESFTVALVNRAAPQGNSPATEVESQTVSLLNGTAPPGFHGNSFDAESLTVSLLNGVPPVPHIPVRSETESLTVSLLNGIAPPIGPPARLEAESPTVSLLNGIGPPHPTGTAAEADSLTVSLLNGIGPPVPPGATPGETESLTVSLLNGIAPPVPPKATFVEADSLTVSLLNGIAPAVLPGTSLVETEGLTMSLLNGTAPMVLPMTFEADSLTVSLFNSASHATDKKVLPKNAAAVAQASQRSGRAHKETRDSNQGTSGQQR